MLERVISCGARGYDTDLTDAMPPKRSTPPPVPTFVFSKIVYFGTLAHLCMSVYGLYTDPSAALALHGFRTFAMSAGVARVAASSPARSRRRRRGPRRRGRDARVVIERSCRVIV